MTVNLLDKPLLVKKTDGVTCQSDGHFIYLIIQLSAAFHCERINSTAAGTTKLRSP